jgi:hypothetical protein
MLDMMAGFLSWLSCYVCYAVWLAMLFARYARKPCYAVCLFMLAMLLDILAGYGGYLVGYAVCAGCLYSLAMLAKLA